MAEAAPKQSDSMEDILQSIKRIIEDDAEPKPAPAPAPSADVLELTEVIKEDGTLGSLPPIPVQLTSRPIQPPEPAKAQAPASPAVTMQAEKPIPKAVAMPEEGLMSEQAAHAAATALKPIMEGNVKDYSIPHIPSVNLRNGNTVEDLVLEALKPMLKAWLDEHLPLIVQKIVEKEVKRIVTFHQD